MDTGFTHTVSPEQELLDLEKQFWEAMKTRDSRTAERLADDRCFVVGPQGISEIQKSSLGAMVAEAPYELKHYQLDTTDVHVRKIADDVAIVAYKVNERLVVDGKPTALEAYDSTVWVRRNGNWVSALHTETVAGDPFGRDRRA